MRLGILQYNPVLGNFQRNLDKVKQLILTKNSGPLDLLVLPEMALTGYAFKSSEHIRPHLESQHGKTFAAASDLCSLVPSKLILTGYPEVSTDGTRYNSAMLSSESTLLYNYRKKHLYETDETWATPGSSFGIFKTTVFHSTTRSITMAIGICMDMNPYKFQAPFDAYEFGRYCVKQAADIIVVPMAWLRAESPEDQSPDDLQAIRYWLARLGPVLQQDKRTIFIATNRTGQEDSTIYQGNSCVVLIDHGDLTILGKLEYEEDLLVVDIELDQT